MLQPSGPGPLGWGAFSIFAVLAGLALLTGADHAAPGCTGPSVERCDYIATAKAAVAEHSYRRFDPELGFEIVEAGSSVRVQQYLPNGSLAIFEGPAVLIDRKSCRPCSVEVRKKGGAE
ncbi:hypothetical protein [Brevundimonas sp. SH203]|uniref:hypothetical protein n=1 Tax=Brevundimonas sp. SH203 TaxID=345167 RepID=UPI0011774A21|nr:hypothetical protein [Brevundimonas sp. SH203]